MKSAKFVSVFFLSALVAVMFSGPVSGQTTEAANDPHIDKDVRAFLKELNSSGGKPLEELSPEAARAVLTSVQQSVKVDLSLVKTTTKTITQDGITVALNIVKPVNARPGLPVFMFFHGGGWVLGDFTTHLRLVRDLVVGSGAVAVFVNYTPSPEARYPVAINQGYAATKWVAGHGHEIGVDGTRLAVVGNSVGGNMAAVVALMAKEKNGPKLRLQVLLWPVADAHFETASYNEYANGRFLTRNSMKWFWDNYTVDKDDRLQVYASPLQARIEQLTGLPEALVETAENDVLRDEGEAYARKLNEAGVKVTSVRFNGMIHDWGLLNPLANVQSTRSAIDFAAYQLKRAFQKK